MTTKLSIVLDFEGAPIRFSLVNGLAIVNAEDLFQTLGLKMEASSDKGQVTFPTELLDPSNPHHELVQRFSRWLQESIPIAEGRLRKAKIGLRAVPTAKAVASR